MIRIRKAQSKEAICLNCKRRGTNTVYGSIKEITIGKEDQKTVTALCESCLLELGREIWEKDNERR